jgi:DNA helicase II / ATP-dependent DNA helicase PcrA
MEVGLGAANHRSPGTKTAEFGNAVLTGAFRGSAYRGVEIVRYRAVESLAKTDLVTAVYKARKRASGCSSWSVAILVPTKKLCQFVSDTLRAPPAGLSPVSHRATLDMEGALLGAEVVAQLLRPDPGSGGLN